MNDVSLAHFVSSLFFALFCPLVEEQSSFLLDRIAILI